jgi:hypothetical protein
MTRYRLSTQAVEGERRIEEAGWPGSGRCGREQEPALAEALSVS